jgi:hypothetical protein
MIKQELNSMTNKKQPYGQQQFSTTPYQHSKNNLIPSQGRVKFEEQLLPDISGSQSQQSQQRKKRQSFHHNNFSMDHGSS